MEKLKRLKEGNRSPDKKVPKDTTPAYQSELNIVIDRVNELVDFENTFVGGGGEAITYTNPNPMTEDFRGFKIGDSFNETSIKELFDKLLYPVGLAAFTSFSIQSQTSPLQVGASIASNRTFIWTTSNPSSIETNSIVITDVTGGVVLASDLDNDGSEATTHSAITKTSATNHQFRIDGINANGIIFSKLYSVSWQWMRYMGESASESLDEAGIKGLRISALASGFSSTYSFAEDTGKYKYLAYASALGTATNFKNASNYFDIPFEDPEVVSVTNSNGVTTNYNVHRSTNILGGSINIIIS